MLSIYKVSDSKQWHGRIDSETDQDSFRFHQVITCKHLNKLEKKDGEFAILGFACDEGVRRNKGRLGARMAPIEIRKHLAKIPYHFPNGLLTIDVGDIICEHGELEKAQAELGQTIHQLFLKGYNPIILGGGHETLYGHYLGARAYIGSNRKLGIINIDAHFDMREEETPSSGTMFRQILEQDDQVGYLCLGIQKLGNTKALFQTAERYGCTYILEEDIQTNHFQNTFETIDVFSSKYDAIIVTLCTDVINASAAPGVSAPSPLGIEANTVRTLLRHIIAMEKTISFDISEVNPLFDENEKTVRLAAYLVAEVIHSFM